jgi:hypothetical protein
VVARESGSPALLAQVLRRIGDWLRPGGLMVISVPVAAGEGVDPDWLGVPMYFGGLGAEETLAAATAAGLRIERAETLREDEGDGRIVEFLWITAIKD